MRTTSILANKLYADRNETGDVTFIVGSEKIFAHRLILAAISPKYQAQFYGSHPDEGDVYVHDISAAAFKEIIKCLYLEEANFTLDNIEEILNIAKQCLVEHVVTKCSNFLMENLLKMENLLRVYRLANVYDIKRVRDWCEINIRVESLDLFKSADFLECDQYTLLHILNIEHLRYDEMDVLLGCMLWAEAACRRKDLNARDMSNVRNVLGNAFFHIQFWSLTLKELVSFHKSHEGLITSDEFVEITCIMGTLPEFTSNKFKQIRRKKAIREEEEKPIIPKRRRTCFIVSSSDSSDEDYVPEIAIEKSM